ncbi:MAG: class I SAM-dependent RNA methyltransferase [Paracoccus sp. (in: a-proteobacteria)]|nr:class I SAM-dependent RNA methyltransferase [Paracoccus sp. (in: a-proteobacteria)]
MSEWRIERLGRKGDGVARSAAGDSALVARVLPGEVVLGQLVAGRIADPQIVTPAPERVTPACPHYARCGGCSLMHAAPDFVAGWKRAQVETALAAHGISARVAAIATSPEGARRRAVFSGRVSRGKVSLGFHARASDVIVDLAECLVLRPRIVAALPALREMLALAPPKAEASVTVIDGPAGLDVSCSEVSPASPALMARLGEIAARADLARLVWGGEPLMRRPPALPMGRAQVIPPPGAFLQATAEGEAALRAAVLGITKGAGRVVDLFAGVGTFSLPLAARAEVHAVEGLAAPLAALDAAWRGAGGLHKLTTEARDLAANPLQADELNRYDAIVIDPPRSGASAQARQIAASRVRRVAWVSCDPVSFAKDSRVMLDAGWHLAQIVAVDQFRHSPHVETVAAFTRN